MISVKSQVLVEAVESDFPTPYIEDGLLQYLERAFPDRAPDPDESDRKIWMNRGAVDVVRHLKRLHTEQRENMLGTMDNVSS